MNKISLVSVNLVTYNGRRFIEKCLNSVFYQTYSRVELIVIDNNSSDGTFEAVQEITKSAEQKFPVRLIKKEENLGFAAGHNLGIRESRGELILCLNQDVILAPDFIEKAVVRFEAADSKRLAAVQGKLCRLGENFEKTSVVDTAGLQMLKNRRIISRGQGQKDEGQYERQEEIFGVDGAAPVYRREALKDVETSVNGKSEFFDEDFFMYKEDVDLSWHLKLRGWNIIYLPEAVAWHARGSGESAVTNYIGIIKERRKIGKFAKYLSFRNQRLMQIKNELWPIFILDLPWFLFKEIGAWVYIVLFEHNAFSVIKDLIKMIPKALAKRKVIMSRRLVKTGEMAKWFK